MNNIKLINDNKFKSIFLSFNYTLDIEKEDVSKFAILSSILSKCSNKFKNQTEIQKYLFELNGSSFDTNINKYGDLLNIEFSMELINKKYLKRDDILNLCLEFLEEIIYNPIFKNKELDNELFELEKSNTIKKINAVKDDKINYAIAKTENIISKDTLFGSLIYGDENIILKLKKEDILEAYNYLINNSCINIVISGNLDGYNNIKDDVSSIFSKYMENTVNYKLQNNNKKTKFEEFEEIIEKDDINQSIITYVLKLKETTKDDFYKMMLYNSILGGTAGSKLFLNFREKESLAYTVRSNYYRYKNLIVILAAIDYKNYEKSKKVIENEINQMLENITDEEFYSAKENLLSNINEWNDSKIIKEKIFLSNMLYLKEEDITLGKMYERIKAVKKEDVYDIAKRLYINKIYFLGGN